MKYIFFTLLFIASSIANADLTKLETHPNKTGYYHSVRCMGIFGSMIEWIGRDKLGDDYNLLFSNMEQLGKTSLIFAVTEQKIGSLENAQKVVEEDFRAIMEMYIARYRKNYATDGFAWQEDDVTKSDLTYCKAFNTVMSDALNEKNNGRQRNN